MIFLKKRSADVKETKDFSDLVYIDSLTGCRNMSFAVREYERLKKDEISCCIMVRLSNCDNMPFYKAEAYIKEAGRLILSISEDDVCRIENGDFLIFSKAAKKLCEKLEFFTRAMSEGEVSYAVIYSLLDENEDFDLFLKRLKRYMAAKDLEIMTQNA